MPILEETRTLYEVLIRFDQTGAYQGTHAQYLEGVTRDGVLIASQPGPAIPLSAVEGGDAVTLSSVLGYALISAQSALASVTAERDALLSSLAEAQALIAVPPPAEAPSAENLPA